MLILFIGADLLCAENSRVLEELKSPLTQNPLKSAIGETAYNEAMASNEYHYVGNDKCRLCHRDFFIGRKHDLHDHSLEYITSSEYRDNPRCLVCHTTGYGTPSGFMSVEETPRLANVQCEGCHGPGSNHLKIASLKKTGGGLLAGIDNHERLKKMCKACHTSRWNHSFTNASFQNAYMQYKKPAPR